MGQGELSVSCNAKHVVCPWFRFKIYTPARCFFDANNNCFLGGATDGINPFYGLTTQLRDTAAFLVLSPNGTRLSSGAFYSAFTSIPSALHRALSNGFGVAQRTSRGSRWPPSQLSPGASSGSAFSRAATRANSPLPRLVANHSICPARPTRITPTCWS